MFGSARLSDVHHIAINREHGYAPLPQGLDYCCAYATIAAGDENTCSHRVLLVRRTGSAVLARPMAGTGLDAAARAGYEAGLQDAGWRGDRRQVRLGMCLMAARWSWLVPHMLRLATQASHQVYGSLPVDSHHLFTERAEMLRYHTVLASEARALASELDL